MNLNRWLTTPRAGWKPVDLPHTVGTATFLGDEEGNRLRVRYYQVSDPPTLAAKVWFGPGAQGPPRHAHGGSIAALLDEAMGGAAWIFGHPVVAAEITTRFKRMLPLDARYLIRARVVAVRGRKVEAEAELRGLDESLFAEGEGVFVELDTERLDRLAQQAADLRPYLKVRQKP